MKIGIIGGGASGLMLASLLRHNKADAEIEIFERLEHVGKKLLLTGNGKCNLTNCKITRDCYNNDFAYDVASCFDVREYFSSIGLVSYIGEQGRIYPFSNASNSVLDVLRKSIEGVVIHEKTQVNKISCDNDKYLLNTTEGNFEFDIVVMATGGKTYYKDTNSYMLANMLSHRVTNLSPSLCPIYVKENLASIENLRCRVEAKLLIDGKKAYSDKGEVLFKKEYLSGIVMFQLSSMIAKHPYNRYEVILDLAPTIKEEQLVEYISTNSDLIGLFPKMINQYVLKVANSNDPQVIAKTIKNLHFEVVENIDFKNAQVTSGGVMIDELNDTLESKIHKNLYFIGEVVDADGICGGYNLQFAFSSAYRAFSDIYNKVGKKDER